MSDEYEIGYGKPPKGTRFKKGQSGNPKGRPKGLLNLKTDLIETLSERITIREGETARRVNKLRALVLSLTAKGIKGDARAANVVLGLVQQTLQDRPDDDRSPALPPEDEAILRDFLDRASAPPQPTKTEETTPTATEGDTDNGD